MTEQNPNRKFIPSQGADDHAEFDRIMHEIHPKKIPAHFVHLGQDVLIHIKLAKKQKKMTSKKVTSISMRA